jgi:hypothetical protein
MATIYSVGVLPEYEITGMATLDLPTRLVQRKAMAQAIVELLDGAERYAIYVGRSRFDPVTGNERDPILVITEHDLPLASDRIDARFAGARNVVMTVTLPDKVVMNIDFTRRKVIAPISSSTEKAKYTALKSHLRSGTISRFWSPHTPLIASGLSLIVAIAIVANTHPPAAPPHQAASASTATHFIALFSWMFLILALVAGLQAALIETTAGGLRVVPEAFQWIVIRRAARDFRLRNLTAHNFDKTFAVILTATFSVFITWLFTR